MDTSVRHESNSTGQRVAKVPFPRTTYPSSHPADECPACHSESMCWVANGDLDYNYLCDACGRCWALGPPGAVRVSPVSCPGCQHRAACFDQLRQEIAACWWVPDEE